jgi:hypothetical protein
MGALKNFFVGENSCHASNFLKNFCRAIGQICWLSWILKITGALKKFL